MLTEWKKEKGKPETSYATAKQQAAAYSSGVLAGVELASHRYLVLVTVKQISTPEDVIDDSITYRHINIAVDPEKPSAVARRLATR